MFSKMVSPTTPFSPVTSDMFEEAKSVELTLTQMKNFEELIESLEKDGMFKEGAIKLIPPSTYKPKTMSINQTKKMDIPDAYKMYVEEIETGFYKFSRFKDSKEEEAARKMEDAGVPLPSAKTIKVNTLWQKGKLPLHLVGKSPEDLIPLYWDEVTKRAQRDRRTLLAVYGSDRSGTLFKEGENPEYFTLNKLPNILERVVHYFESPIDGVTSPMLYFGTWLSTFVKHLEDKNLWSISYLHFGPPKVWFFLEPIDGLKLEALTAAELRIVMKEHFKHVCKIIFRHKSLLIHPKILKKYGLKIKMVIQKQGEYVVVPPYTYHWGFNCGSNCAEAINFATESWVPYGLLANECPLLPLILDMQFFVLSYFPNDFKDYVNGNYKVEHPLTKEMIFLKKPNSKTAAEAKLTTVRVGGVYNFLAAKTVGSTFYVYMQLCNVKTWVTKKDAEKLDWFEGRAPLRLPEFLFEMNPETFPYFHKVTTLLSNYKGDTTSITLDILKAANFDFSHLAKLNPILDMKEARTEPDDLAKMCVPTEETLDDSQDLEMVPITANPADGQAKSFLSNDSSRTPQGLDFETTREKICVNCGKRAVFYKKSDFFRHVRECGKPGVKCPFCDTTIKRKYNLMNHINRKHLPTKKIE